MPHTHKIEPNLLNITDLPDSIEFTELSYVFELKHTISIGSHQYSRTISIARGPLQTPQKIEVAALQAAKFIAECANIESYSILPTN